METEKVEHLLTEVRDRMIDGRITQDMLDMGEVLNDCGTSGCIGGWCLWIDAGENVTKLPRNLMSAMHSMTFGCDPRRLSLRDLFFKYPDHCSRVRYDKINDKITLAKAIQAINAWLEGKEGNPWDYVVEVA